MDGYDYKQPEDTVRGFNEYSSSLKPVGEVSVCTTGTPRASSWLVYYQYSITNTPFS